MKYNWITKVFLLTIIIAWTACYVASGDSVTNYTESKIEVIVEYDNGDKITVQLKPGATLSTGERTEQLRKQWVSLTIRGDYVDVELNSDQIAMFERRGPNGELHLHVYRSEIVSSGKPK